MPGFRLCLFALYILIVILKDDWGHVSSPRQVFSQILAGPSPQCFVSLDSVFDLADATSARSFVSSSSDMLVFSHSPLRLRGCSFDRLARLPGVTGLSSTPADTTSIDTRPSSSTPYVYPLPYDAIEPEAVITLEPKAVSVSEPKAAFVSSSVCGPFSWFTLLDFVDSVSVPSLLYRICPWLADKRPEFKFLYSHLSRLLVMLIDMNVHKIHVEFMSRLAGLLSRRSYMRKHIFSHLLHLLVGYPPGYIFDCKPSVSCYRLRRFAPLCFETQHVSCCLGIPSLLRVLSRTSCFLFFRDPFSFPSLPLHGHPRPVGGAAVFSFLPSEVEPYVVNGHDNLGPDITLKYVAHVDSTTLSSYKVSKGFVHAQVPVHYLVRHLSMAAQKGVARLHGISIPNRSVREDMPTLFDLHSCLACNLLYSVFYTVPNRQTLVKSRMRDRYANRPALDDAARRSDESGPEVKECAPKVAGKEAGSSRLRPAQSTTASSLASHACPITLDADAEVSPTASFPPAPLTPDLARKIMTGFCKATSAQFVEEAGCAVCGLLHPVKKMVPLKNIKRLLHILKAPGVTRVERRSADRTISDFSGPVIDCACNKVCESCRISIGSGKVPKTALANGLWLGDVPPALKNLNFVEKLLVARVRHTRCYTRVTASGLSKMKAHVIAFQAPVEKVYDVLPPPVEDLDDVLAILFTGGCQPTEADMKRTPLLVRRKAVLDALEWLKLNHSDYKELGISYKNLSGYPEDRPPVSIVFRQSSFPSSSTEQPATFDDGSDEGTEGECPFVVHGLTGHELSTKSVEALKGIALKHWRSNGKALRVGHSDNPKSTFNDPSLYPQMFPWLFPYGLGGIGACTSGLSVRAHKKNLLMYHDKQFQLDVEFPFVAFSHEQVKAATSGGYLAVRKKNFEAMAERLLSLDQSVLESIGERMASGEVVKPATEEEKQCFQVVNDLDAIAGKVDGSGATKKLMRSEIWSLMVNKGAPSWYITLSPADLKHPICLYFADTKRAFQPSIPVTGDDAFCLISRNPVAGARFFHFMVSAFIIHVLGVGSDHSGLYGDTSAYYGTVEQQGRLTLHLHMLLWIEGGLSPDEARRKIMDTESNFQKAIVEYLEAAYQGDFISGDKDKVAADVEAASQLPGYINPTQQMPEPPPEPCESRCDEDECKACSSLKSWWGRFCITVDALIYRSNIHTCTSTLNRDGTQKKNKEHKGCLDNIWGKCKARFPRPLFAQTEVDPVTGALNMKKKEPWINTFTAPLTFLFRCNTDVTSLRSGTAIKAIILYVTKYVTKPMLKMYVAFDAVKAIFNKNTIVLGGSLPRQEKARSLMTKIVNTLSAKSEMGSPMICMYLLQNPDHYTNYTFVPLYWTSYVREARKVWDPEETDADACPEKVTILKIRGSVVGLSSVYDYIYRSPDLENMSLYEWASRCTRVKPSADDKVFLAGSKSSRRAKSSKNPHRQQVKSVLLPFAEAHPLASTHVTMCGPPCCNKIPSLMGGTLPRRDQGDREYYCSTMLTLFKPWRTGRDLKSADSSWDQSFLDYNFSPAHLAIMNNMNLRYECLDARDDYHAQLKAGAVGLPAAFSRDDVDDQILGDLDQQEYGESEMDEMGESEGEEAPLTKSEQSRRSNIGVMTKIMSMVGWTAPLPAHCPDFETAVDGDIAQDVPASQWRMRVADKRADILACRSRNLPAGAGTRSTTSNVVDVVSKSFLDRGFKSPLWEPVVCDVVSRFGLNAEQERAFRIVANHAADPQSDQLKMYMGGMGGTGKSQVLKALIDYFTIRQESHRLVVVAPTGTAASLLGGSTYHYMFGINDHANATTKMQLAQVKSRLIGVDYIFFDEVSMLSCHDMYRIASRLALISGDLSMPFGGMNMLFAGDFAQLPPVIGGEHASLYSRTVGGTTSSLKDQEAAIGKSVWHQVTTVVILRKNMRQTRQSTRDDELRLALENMRYKACTPADIAFLRSRISSNLPGRPKVSDPEFRNVSVITALNVHKDAINIAGSDRFALESDQPLVSFYSEDTLATDSNPDDALNPRKCVSATKVKPKSGGISNAVQKRLWDQPPCANTKCIAGTLKICAGLPVIIRHNAATELCITNGQEGLVFGWQEAVGSRGQRILDTLFVKLTDPPTTVQLDGLPENVVPLIKTTTTTKCQMPSDEPLTVSRSQVEVLPNYAMTDYSSQGKTRPYNVVDLNNCRSHQSYYTALSRSASADGTLILQGFDAGKITGKATGALRQEFRELELLDEITRLRYQGRLPKGMHDADRRNTLISSFRSCKGEGYVPSLVHKAIKWGKGDPYLETPYDDVPWSVIEKSQTVPAKGKSVDGATYVPARGADAASAISPFVNLEKRKNDASRVDPPVSRKKRRIVPETTSDSEKAPTGTQWQNNSCAYDAVITVIHEAWKDRPDLNVRSIDFSSLNDSYLGTMDRLFQQRAISPDDPGMSLEGVRDSIRRALNLSDPEMFPYGEYTSVHSLLDCVFATAYPVTRSTVTCRVGHAINRSIPPTRTAHVVLLERAGESVQNHVSNLRASLGSRCRTCRRFLTCNFTFVSAPLFLAFDVSKVSPRVNYLLDVPLDGGRNVAYMLVGVIYYGDYHFTCRVVNRSRNVWFHDGIATGSSLQSEGPIESIDLLNCRTKSATALLYVRR